GPPQGERLHGDVRLVPEVFLRGAQARDPWAATGPRDVRLGLPGAGPRPPLPGLGVRRLPGRRAGEGLPPERRAHPGPPPVTAAPCRARCWLRRWAFTRPVTAP